MEKARSNSNKIRRRAAVLIIAAGFACVAAGTARADQVSALGRNYAGVQILGLEDGLLQVRTPEGTTLPIPLADVDWLIVDRTGPFDDLNEAERLMLSGDAAKAVSRYDRASRVAAGFWADVVCARSLAAHDQLGQLDEAMHHLVRLAQSRLSGPAVASRMIPKSIPAQRNARFARSIRELEAALATAKLPAERALLTLVRFDLLRRSGDKRATAAAEAITAMSVPPEVRTPQVYAMLTAALDSALEHGEPGLKALEALDRAVETCPEENLPDLLMLKGRVLLSRATTREDIMRAAWPSLRVAIHMPQDPRSGGALYAAATALERLRNRSEAAVLLDECLLKPALSQELREQAEDLRRRMQPDRN